MATRVKTAPFYGGPYHEHSLEVESPGGVLPLVYVIEIPAFSQIGKKYFQKYAHYKLRNCGKTLLVYTLVGYSKDGKTLSTLPTSVFE